MDVNSALIRMQEQESMQVTIPFTTTNFASILSTGALLTTFLNKLFVKPTPFEDRSRIGLDLVASDIFSEVEDDGVDSTGNLGSIQVRLLLWNGATEELDVNPIDYDSLLMSPAVKYCDMVLDETVTSHQTYMDHLYTEINKCTGFDACRPSDCDESEFGDFYNCDCDVVVGVNSDSLAFIYTVAATGDATLSGSYENIQDFHLLALYNITEPYEESSLLGLPLNVPANPALVSSNSNSRTRDWSLLQVN